MKISASTSEKAILKELGERIKIQRIALCFTQDEFAKKCGLSLSTEQRIENGADSKVSNYIKILSTLDLLENIDLLVPEEETDYKAIFENKPTRKRASSKRKQSKTHWVWEEDK